MLCCIYALNAYIKMPSKCTQIYTHNVVMRIVVGFFQWFFPLWISLPETWRDGCPGRWDLRVLEVCVVNRWKLLVSYCPLKHLMSHCPKQIYPVLAHSLCHYSDLHTYVYINLWAEYLEYLFLLRYGPSFDSTLYSFSTICFFFFFFIFLSVDISLKCFQN